MPNDAKLGLVVGLALVLAVAIVFFRKDSSAANDPADTNVKSSPANATPTLRSTAVARVGNNSPTALPSEATVRKHTVLEGESLFSLAQRYYGTGEHFQLISRANHSSQEANDPLPPGTVLVIPEMPEPATTANES